MWQLRDALYDWVPGKFGPIFENLMGICEENSKKCNQAELICDLGTPDCRRIKPGKEMDHIMDNMAASYLTFFTHGKCQHNSETSGWCSKLNLCNKYYVQNDEKCKDLDLTEDSADVEKIMENTKHTKGYAYAVEYDVPAGSYTLAEQERN